jgi:uncharacterized protein
LIIRNILTPEFKAGNYFTGIDTATGVILSTIESDTSAMAQTEALGVKNNVSSFITDNIFVILFFGYILITWVGSILARSKSWWGGGIIGAILGIISGHFFGYMYIGLFALLIFIPLGLFLDFIVSRSYTSHKSSGTRIPWWGGGNGFGGGSSSGGGFGGFGGGSSGGGGASGGW